MAFFTTLTESPAEMSSNHCRLTINSFGGGKKKYISGNQCQKGLGLANAEELPDLYGVQLLGQFLPVVDVEEGIQEARPLQVVHIPVEQLGVVGHHRAVVVALGMYELLPLWHAFFSALGFKVEVSGLSTRRIYEKGQFSIPSDTACYPAKIMHGHMEVLLDRHVDAIFYPCLTYNVNEKQSALSSLTTTNPRDDASLSMPWPISGSMW